MDIEPAVLNNHTSDFIDDSGDEFHPLPGDEVAVDDADTFLCVPEMENEIDGGG